MPPVQNPQNGYQPPLTDPTLNYDFILQSQPPTKKGMRSGPGGGPSQTQRIAIVVGGAVLLIIIIFATLGYFQAQSKKGATEFYDLAAYQAEIQRVADLGVKSGGAISTRSIAETTSIVMSSDLSSASTLLAGQGIKVDAAKLTKYQNVGQVDNRLDAAQKANDFDSVYTSILANSIAEYRKRLNTTYGDVSSAKVKAALKVYDTNMKTILGGTADATTSN